MSAVPTGTIVAPSFNFSDELLMKSMGMTLFGKHQQKPNPWFTPAVYTEISRANLESAQDDGKLRYMYMLVTHEESKLSRFPRNTYGEMLFHVREDARRREDYVLAEIMDDELQYQRQQYARNPWDLLPAKELGELLERYDTRLYEGAITKARESLGFADNDPFPFK